MVFREGGWGSVEGSVGVGGLVVGVGAGCTYIVTVQNIPTERRRDASLTQTTPSTHRAVQ